MTADHTNYDDHELHERISRRAYEIYLERNGAHGIAEDDWLQAEEEILAHHEADQAKAEADVEMWPAP